MHCIRKGKLRIYGQTAMPGIVPDMSIGAVVSNIDVVLFKRL